MTYTVQGHPSKQGPPMFTPPNPKADGDPRWPWDPVPLGAALTFCGDTHRGALLTAWAHAANAHLHSAHAPADGQPLVLRGPTSVSVAIPRVGGFTWYVVPWASTTGADVASYYAWVPPWAP